MEAVSQSLEDAGYAGFTISDVRGHGQSPEKVGEWRGQTYELHVTHKLLIEIVVEDGEVDGAVKAIIRAAQTGAVGDGLITVSDLAAVYSIRTGGATVATTASTPSPATPGAEGP
jgi:nitrogen regulatory protein PII